ncbi:MAG TPA: nitroreductase [Chthoniobacteraceae bacterium]|nr:nitroreductase [Chthoniobacteraceae bacterium]
MSSDFPYRTRRTIKPHQMDPAREVPRDLLLEILTDAHWAPTHGLTQPWRFHVFTGPARERLADGLQSLYDRLTPAAEIRPDKREKLRANTLAAPVVIAVAARVDPAGKITETEEIAATSCAVENLMLSAHQRGLASFWASPPVAYSPDFVKWLGLDTTHRALGLVYLGHAQPGTKAASTRVPLNERVVFYDI